MKSRETKQRDLEALTASLANSKSAMVVSFKGVTVTKDQEFRNSIRDAGANYQVVKNTLARLAVQGTAFEQANDSFKGVSAIAWTDSDPVVLSKAISKFMKDNADIYTFKTGVVDGRLVDLMQVTEIASLPSKEELISKLLFVINAQAQRIVTVINAVPRDLAVVIKQIGEKAPDTPSSAKTEEAKPAEPVAVASEPQPASAETVDTEAPSGEGESPAAEAASGGEDNGGQPEAPTEAAEEAQETKENEQDPGSPEGEQADEAEEKTDQ